MNQPPSEQTTLNSPPPDCLACRNRTGNPVPPWYPTRRRCNIPSQFVGMKDPECRPDQPTCMAMKRADDGRMHGGDQKRHVAHEMMVDAISLHGHNAGQ